jgi:hypothetical protein
VTLDILSVYLIILQISIEHFSSFFAFFLQSLLKLRLNLHVNIRLKLALMLQQNTFIQNSLLLVHNPMVFFQSQLLIAFSLELRVVIDFLVELFLEVVKHQIFRKPRMEQVGFNPRRHQFMVPCQPVLEMPEKQTAKIFDFLEGKMAEFEIKGVERMLAVPMDHFSLCLDALFVVLVMDCVDAEPGRNGSGVHVDVVDEERTTHWQYLNYRQGLEALYLLPHTLLQSLLLDRQGTLARSLLLPEGVVGCDVLF